jgi:secreted trypsin-like serine protease
MSTISLFVVLLGLCRINGECGSSLTARIIAGDDATDNAWPWAVSIRIGRSGVCTGSLITERFVLTAAHCVIKEKRSVIVYAGSVQFFQGTQIRQVLRMFVHNNYNSTLFINNIALLELSSPLDTTSIGVGILCLPSFISSITNERQWPAVDQQVPLTEYRTFL